MTGLWYYRTTCEFVRLYDAVRSTNTVSGEIERESLIQTQWWRHVFVCRIGFILRTGVWLTTGLTDREETEVFREKRARYLRVSTTPTSAGGTTGEIIRGPPWSRGIDLLGCLKPVAPWRAQAARRSIVRSIRNAHWKAQRPSTKKPRRTRADKFRCIVVDAVLDRRGNTLN